MDNSHQQRLLDGYRNMVLTRQFDKKAINLQRVGKMGTYASCLGAEAIHVAAGMCLTKGDYFAPYYRDSATLYLRGVPLENILQYWGGDERGSCFPADSDAAHDLPFCVPIATQLTQAAGMATAAKLRGEKACVLVTCGDGATSRGDFHEALNVAAVWHLPLVVLVINNQWAISVPLHMQTASPSIAARGAGMGLPGEQVDGNDMEAMLEVLDRAFSRARAGKGPTLIEAMSYRLGDHTTADDASKYRKSSELHAAWQREPIRRLRDQLADAGLWDADKETAWLEECDREVEAAVGRYLNVDAAPATDMLDYLYTELPASLAAQRAVLANIGPQGGQHA